MTIAQCTAVAKRLALGNFGYGQDDRTSALADNGKLGVDGLKEPGDTDCSFSMGIIYYLGGLIDRDVLRGTFYTGNLASKLVGTGMFVAISVNGWSLAKIKREAREGDGLLGPGHVVYCLGDGRCVSFENTEKGGSTGGKLGDQTGREGRIRDIYDRSRGWAYILRPVSVATLKKRIIAARAADQSAAVHLDNLARIAPADGVERWRTFNSLWAGWIRNGLKLAYDADHLVVPTEGHAFVILGSTVSKMKRRVAVALPAILANPASKVIVTGGTKRDGISEAEHMKRQLIAGGVAADRIIKEYRSYSTVGNAKLSEPLLRGFASYTLVSDASHLRRAAILFLAAQIKAYRLVPAPTMPLAFNDYGDKPVATEAPASAATRTTISNEVAILLGLN